MEVETPSLPKGVLPADFFDDRVEGALAMGLKKKQAEKLAKEYKNIEWFTVEMSGKSLRSSLKNKLNVCEFSTTNQ